MKILVPCKRVPDADQRVTIRDDGSIDEANLSFFVNPFDAIALEEALRLRETFEDVEVVSVTVGSEVCEKELRTCLAMGADRGILVQSEEQLDPWNVSTVIREIAKRESPDLILMGKQAIDDDANQTGQFLAGRLGWPQATFASKLDIDSNRKTARVARETDVGIETMTVVLPAVVTVDLRLNEPRYASLPSIMKARKKTIETHSLNDLRVTVEPRVRVLKLEAVNTQRSCVTVETAGDLVRRLKDEAKVL